MVNPDNLPENLNVDNANDIAFIKSRNDPAIWHAAAMATLAYRGDTHGILSWLVEQPNMDRATAGWLFLWLQGSRYLQGQIDGFWARIDDDYVVRLLAALCERSETIGFLSDRIGLEEGFEQERQLCLTALTDGQIASGIVVPHAIIRNPFRPPTEDGPYVVDDGLLLSIDFLRNSLA